MIFSSVVLPAGSTRAFMARVVADDGVTPLVQADVSAVAYTISDVSASLAEAVTGHDAQALAVASVIFDTLQSGAPWTTDAAGYNFRFSPSIAENAAFPDWGTTYLLVVTLTRNSGDPIVFAWRVRTPEL